LDGKKEWVESAKKTVFNHWKDHYKPMDSAENNDSNNKSQTSFQDIFQSSMKKVMKPIAEDEMKRYLSESPVNSELLMEDKTGIDGALGWWKVRF
jgi:hypothetical protein